MIDAAKQDIRDIFEYLAYDLLEPDIAEGVTNRLLEKIGGLCHMPHKYQRIEEKPYAAFGWHVAPMQRYRILYALDEERHAVIVLAVLHSMQDPLAQLREAALSRRTNTPPS